MTACEYCDGRGWNPDQSWVEFHDYYRPSNSTLVKAFFRERGIETPPNYRARCAHCGGSGIVADPPVRDPAQLLALVIIGTVGYVVGMAVGYLAWG